MARLKVPANTDNPVSAGGQTYPVKDNHIEVPESAVAELEGRGFTRDPASKPEPAARR